MCVPTCGGTRSQQTALRHPPGYDKAQVARQRDRAVGRGQPGLTGPQRGRGQEGEVGALSQGSPEGSARVSSTHCFCQDCLLVCV